MANKVVVLRVDQGCFEQGFTLTLQIGAEATRPSCEMMGALPAAAQLPRHYLGWQTAYQRLGLPLRIEPAPNQVTNISRFDDCRQAAVLLKQALNEWLSAETFRPLREKLLEQLSTKDRIRFLLQTDDLQLQKLPWHSWDLLERYPQAEMSLATFTYASPPSQVKHPPGDVRILAILGSSRGIDVTADQVLLKQLPRADIRFLVEPNRRQLNDELWEQHWDILFFAGHSCSQGRTSGTLSINRQDSLAISDLRYGLRKAVDNGLQLAILNSCDGLGVGRALADAQIPQLVVMREPVPDPVAQEFLKYFLQSYAQGNTLYLAMREARERLQGLEEQYPCATWLPVICQNPAVLPPSWLDLSAKPQPLSAATPDVELSLPRSSSVRRFRPRRWWRGLCTASLLATALVFAGRWVGILQPSELWAFDRLLPLRPPETPDDRFLIITISESEVQAQGEEARRSSLSDAQLSELLAILKPHQPRVIGLDIYRDFAVRPDQAVLRQQLQDPQGLVGICKNSDADLDPTGISPPPELSSERIGFSDFVTDPDGALRRQLLYMTPDPASPCPTAYSFSTLLALHYLAPLKIEPQFTSDSRLQLGQVVLPKLDTRTGGYQTVDAGGIQMLLNYRALKTPEDIAPRVSLTQVLQGQVDPDRIKDKIVLIGVAASSSDDLWITPYGARDVDQVPGVFLQAQMTSQILSAVLDRRSPIRAWPMWGDALWVLTWSTIGGILALWLRGYRPFVMVGTATLGALVGCCFVMLIQGWWLPLVPAVLAYLATAAQVARAAKRSSTQGAEL